jgi:tetratricopeptide (TPR) repeat protein
VRALAALLVALLSPAAAQAPSPVERAVALFDARRYEEAKPLLADAATADAREPRAAFYLGRIAMIEGDYDDAVRWLETAVRLDDRDALRHFRLGEAYAQQAQRGSKFRAFGLARRARAELERAVALDPNLVDARMALVQFYLVAPGIVGGSRGKAEAQLPEIRRRNPYRARIAAALVFEDRDDTAGARREYEAAIHDQPDSAAAFYALGLLHQRLGRTEAAFDAFERAAATNAVETSALYALGRLAAMTGQRLDRGEEALRRYLATPPGERSPPLSSAHYRLGTIYERTGRRDLARREYEAALRIEDRGEYREALARVR